MRCYILLARPHGNLIQQIRDLKRQAMNWEADPLAMALPEGFICGCFDSQLSQARAISNEGFPEADNTEASSSAADTSVAGTKASNEQFFQHALVRHAQEICASLPDVFRFESVVQRGGKIILESAVRIDAGQLKEAMRKFAKDAGLVCRESPAGTYNGIWLGNGSLPELQSPLSFKKYELVLYLAELPESPLNGYYFKTIARVHRKMPNHARSRKE